MPWAYFATRSEGTLALSRSVWSPLLTSTIPTSYSTLPIILPNEQNTLGLPLPRLAKGQVRIYSSYKISTTAGCLRLSHECCSVYFSHPQACQACEPPTSIRAREDTSVPRSSPAIIPNSSTAAVRANHFAEEVPIRRTEEHLLLLYCCCCCCKLIPHCRTTGFELEYPVRRRKI
ncbi:hypothetical protein BCV69DRAFT_163076 [Microstroma glucosiphilum]|uniref:Uncharacterized protein n=1 Tax=Pseudomicrostroma glucosiphilum TaxID=1684307 RepID=A0A316UB17_9BASI|nr:hypothetical protein BCV69DRAFT_163076 [Pseudomicrostroma glucosiphilum]PWN22048.1 hypothetical protein BCV69DRAFT_163076 [Pseudomicrostroma glucosiphilum]